MSVNTGPILEIYPDTTIPGTAAVAMTAFRAMGNSIKLHLTTTTGGCVSLTFTAEFSYDGTNYFDVIDRDSVWSQVCTSPNVAGSYVLDLEGLTCVPGIYVRLSYTANTKAGKLKVIAQNWENPKGGGISVSVPDVVVDIDAIKVSTDTLDNIVQAEDAAHTTADSGVMGLAVRNDTLAALAGTDGDYAPLQVNADGALYSEVSTLPGGLTAYDEDTAHTTADKVIMSGVVRADAAASLADTDGDITIPIVDASGRTWTHDPVAEALLTTIDADTSKIPSLGTAIMTGSAPVTVATDDTQFGAVGAAADVDGNIHGQLRYSGEAIEAARVLLATIDADTSKIPSLGTAIMTGAAPVTLATDDTQFGAVGAAADVDGNIHGQLRSIGEAVEIMDNWDDGADHCETVNPYKPTKTQATGAAAIATSTALAAPFELISIRLHLSAAGTTAEDFTVTLNDGTGAAYDTLLYSLDLSVSSVTDLVLTPDKDDIPKYYSSTDVLDIAWANTETRTYGLTITTRQV
jgi:hypothetical protein